jgi:hypothetical protein
MKIISHRGNLNGANLKLENNPQHILKVLEKYDVEIDAWYKEDRWFLGHDEPTYEISRDFFKPGMWVHCKNIEAAQKLNFTQVNYFWHESDRMTITGHGYIWCFPRVYVKSGITVELGYNKDVPDYVLGICTDYPELYS